MAKTLPARRARMADLDRILEIELASFGKYAWDRNLFADYLRQCGSLFLVTERGGKVCGYSITCVTGGQRPRAELVSIAVDPAALGTGASILLMNSTFRRLRLRQILRISLTVKVTNSRARAFYEKYGFTKVRRLPGYYEDGEDGLLMTLDLCCRKAER